MDRPETRYVLNRDGLALAYQIIGEGPTDIVFQPFFGCIDLIWEDHAYAHFLNRLAGLGRLILFDVRGVGASDPLPLPGLPTPETWMDDLRVVLDAAESKSTAIVGAGGYGIMGMFFAATHPERTKALVLIDSYARWLMADDYPFGGTPEGIRSALDVFRHTWGKGYATASSIPSRSSDEEFVRWLAKTERLSASPAEMALYWEWLLTVDVRQILPAIKVPTLVMDVHPSALMPTAFRHYLAEHIPDARFLKISGTESYLFSRSRGDDVIDSIAEFITGTPPVREPDRHLATVLFTDIVESTPLASRLSDKPWTELLDRHDAIFNRELERHRGQKVQSTGDGLVATFDGPARAIHCAQSMCSSVRSLGIEVRAGLHTGEVERRGGSIDGIAVHIGQRVSALAGPGEVLVSSTVKDLVLGSGIRFEDRGIHRLKGVPDEWRLFAVESQGVRGRLQPGRSSR